MCFPINNMTLTTKCVNCSLSNLINVTNPYFTKQPFVYWFTLAAGRALQIGYYSDSNRCAQNLLYPARNEAYCVFKATCKDFKALFKLICKCLLMCPMRVYFCSLIYVCLPFISYISMSQKYVLTPKYANCPNPAGRRKAVKSVSRFKFAVLHFQMSNTFQYKHNWKPWH